MFTGRLNHVLQFIWAPYYPSLRMKHPPHTAVHSKENDVRLAGEQAAWLARASLKLLGSQLATTAQPSATALKADGYILFLFGKKIHSTINDSWSVSSTIFFYIKIKDDLERFLMASQ